MDQTAPISVNYGEHFQKGISFEQYVLDFEKSLNLGDQVFNYQYLPLNWQRSQRILKHFAVAASTQEVMENLDRPIQWLLITEPWCGDASQIVPVIAKIAEASAGKIDLRLVYCQLGLHNNQATVAQKPLVKDCSNTALNCLRHRLQAFQYLQFVHHRNLCLYMSRLNNHDSRLEYAKAKFRQARYNQVSDN
jgi:hypothetical protein